MTGGRGWQVGLTALLACGGPTGRTPATADGVAKAPATDSLVLTGAEGVEIWYTLARDGTGPDGSQCVERGLEIRQGGKRIQVPLLYTGSPPVLLNDSTMRAILWTHCTPGEAYRMNLRSGQPVREHPGAVP